MRRAAQHRAIAQKVEAEGWAGGISFHWLLRLSQIKKSWCNGICRFAVLRWALNQDDDVWLSLRGTRHNQPCQLCGKSTDIYPKGFWHFPICESCIRSQEITPASLRPDSPVLVDLYRTEALQISSRSLPILYILVSKTVPQRVRFVSQQTRTYVLRFAPIFNRRYTP